MCAMSMIMDAKLQDWGIRYGFPPYGVPHISSPFPSQMELDEFCRLLDRAREYDRKHNEPDCELEEKRQKLKDLAETLGVKIEFV